MLQVSGTANVAAPDATSTASLLGLALFGIGAIRRRLMTPTDEGFDYTKVDLHPGRL